MADPAPAPAAAPAATPAPAPAAPAPAAPAVAPAAAPAALATLLTDPPAAAAPDAPKPDAAPDAPKPDAPAEPVKYTDFTLPDGIKADNPLVSAFVEAAGGQKLSQEGAQAVLDAVAPKVAEMLAAPQQEWQRLNTEWQTAVKADPEIGGANFDTMRATVAKVLDDPALADPQLRQALDMTGAGNNPAVIRTLYRLAKAVTEGGPARPGAPAAPRKSAADILYPPKQA